LRWSAAGGRYSHLEASKNLAVLRGL
jgi:hypothetical protein